MEDNNGVIATEPKIDRVIRRLEELPTLPLVVLKVMEILDRREASLADLSRIIRGDQSLTTKVLKVVNSAYYGFPKRISTISLAVVILGTENVKNLILSISIMDLVSRKVYRGNINRQKLWAHPVFCASASRVMAKLHGCDRLEEAFVAGLIHDIGKIVIDRHFHDAFVRIQSLESDEGFNRLDEERRLVGMDHSEIGRRLCERWNFPDSLSEAVGGHHDPESLEERESLAAFVYLGNLLSKHAMRLNEDERSENEELCALADLARLEKDQIAVVIEDTQREFQRANVFLEL